tara:strand:+ start:350 stop:1024 length:675 start_codon:yes stop_codon:yes gene_type:complete
MNLINIYDINDLYSKFTDIKYNNIPTVFINGMDIFPQLKKWNTDYILNNYGENLCSITYDNDAVANFYFSNKCITYKDYFNDFNHTLSITRNDNINEKNSFINDITFPNPFFKKEDIIRYYTYCGPPESGILPHYHSYALNLMTYGMKEWIFYDNIKLTDYYEIKYIRNVKYKEWYKNEYTNLKKNNKIIEYIQNTNDVVFIPKNYSHGVYNKQHTLGIVIEFN